MIELRDLAKTYVVDRSDVAVEALRGITLSIREGEMVAVMGASGSGKSSLLNIIGCLDRPSRGSYRLDGEDKTISPHLNHQVEITGTVSPASAAGAGAVAAPTLKIESLKMIAAKCS